MSPAGRLAGGTGRTDREINADALSARVDALGRFTVAAEPHVPPALLEPAREVTRRAGDRLRLSRDHTVVALAGATGSGKSSIFNAVAGMQLSPAGVRRPTTGHTHACVWRAEGADDLLDWLDIPRRFRFVRESPLDAEEQAPLRGLVLLDLPDFDSIEVAHRAEVDRLLRLVDLVVWVTDPQKYADEVIHDQYLRMFHRHDQNMVVVLNQADRLAERDVARCVAHLRVLLDADGLGGVPVLTTSATTSPLRIGELRDVFEQAVTDRVAVLQRLEADLDDAAEGLEPLRGTPAESDIDRSARDLADALAASAGVAGVSEAIGEAYAFRAGKSVGWPLTRWIRTVRPDPVARIRLGRANTGEGNGGGGTATPVTAERSTTSIAVRELGQRSGTGLPPVWSAAVRNAARSHDRELAAALDGAVVGTDLGLDRKPLWWRLLNVVQWLFTLTAFVGAVWLIARLALSLLGLPTFDVVRAGPVPLAALLLAGGVVAGILLALLAQPLIGLGARHSRERASSRLHGAISEVSESYVVEPVRTVLHDYANARSALAEASH
jgi:GTP-binding protein EngB required for normal cell division